MSSAPGVLLIHGMGRTPLSMALLGHRLRKAGLDVHTFGYSAAVESFGPCVDRLRARIQETFPERPYLLVGHSLGTVLIRGALAVPSIPPPRACFFLAPPSRSPRLARRLAGNPIYRAFTGEMGQLLADPAFMDALPVPPVPTTVFAGDRGWQGRLSPFGGEPNDGIVSFSEAQLGEAVPLVRLPVLHTFIMNARSIADGIARAAFGTSGALR
ncbi:MAG TPA: alpha/beta fold hydrolase [Holophagaceae bacterium]|nr:alpha/beta fold hydrolase [Holophagaceae bacterium]